MIPTEAPIVSDKITVLSIKQLNQQRADFVMRNRLFLAIVLH